MEVIMEYDIFGNPIIDSRSTTRKKIDELWNTYCEMFDTFISLDEFALDEEDFLGIMLRSIEDKSDYLKAFILSDKEGEDIRDELIKDITDDSCSELLKKAYVSLALKNYNLDRQYMILNMIYEYLNNCDGDINTYYDNLVNELKEKETSELLELASNYQWWPEEILELRKLCENVLDKEKNGGDLSNNSFDNNEIMDRIKDLYRIIQVTNYKYAGRERVVGEYIFLRNRIEQTCERNVSTKPFENKSDSVCGEDNNRPLFGAYGFSEWKSFEKYPFSDKNTN